MILTLRIYPALKKAHKLRVSWALSTLSINGNIMNFTVINKNIILGVIVCMLLSSCVNEGAPIETNEEALLRAKKHIDNELNLFSRSSNDYSGSVEFLESFTLPKCEGKSSFYEGEWEKCNPPMFSVTLTYEKHLKKYPEEGSLYESEIDKKDVSDKCVYMFDLMLLKENGRIVDKFRHYLIDENSILRCD